MTTPRRRRPWSAFAVRLATLALVLLPSRGAALLDDDEGQWRLIGKVRLETTFRTIAAPDNNPVPVVAGNLISQRNLLFLDFNHDLGYVQPWLDLSYYLEARLFYDSVWDIGPDAWSDDVTRAHYLFDNRDQINRLDKSAELFLGYVDAKADPVFVRAGKQILSWGEMSTFRVLDEINPLDTSSLSVDLLERRVPLAMLRANLALYDLGPLESLSLQGYYVNGGLDDTTGEPVIDGSPIIPPVGRYTVEDLEDPLSIASLMQIVDQHQGEIQDDRFGARLGVGWKGLEISLAWYRTYSSIPVPFLDIDAFQPIDLTWRDIASIVPEDPLGSILGDRKLDVVLTYDTVDVFGASFNYEIDALDVVMRGETAYRMDVPKIEPGSVADLIEGLGGKIHLPVDDLTLADLLAHVDLSDLGSTVLPFSSGKIAKYDEWRYGLGFDKMAKIPALNDAEFLFILEYVGSHIMGHRDGTIVLPWQGPAGQVLYEPEWSNVFVGIARTEYLNGNLVPKLVTMYEIESRALAFIPSIEYQWRTMQFEVNYFHTFSDSYVGFLGQLESRDELSLRYTFNF